MTGRALTARQRQVLLLAAFGNTNVQIGRQLGIHPQTVNRHLAVIYDALGARDRANAVAIAIHRGDISLGELGRIAAATTVRGSEGARTGPGAPQGALEAVGGVPVVQGAAKPAEEAA